MVKITTTSAASVLRQAVDDLCGNKGELFMTFFEQDGQHLTTTMQASIEELSLKETDIILSKMSEYIDKAIAEWFEGNITDEECKLYHKYLISVTEFMRVIATDPRRVRAPFFSCINRLHDVLLRLGIEKDAPILQDKIAQVCETLWERQTPGAEYLITQLIPHLLVGSLSSQEQPRSSTQCFIKRLYDVRNAMHLLEFQDESICFLKELLLRTFLEPLFLNSAIGVKFLTFTFSLDIEFVDEIHQLVRSQLLLAQRETVAKKYGMIYFQAWNGSPETLKVKIEERCIQDIIYTAVHANSDAMFKGFRVALSVFHDQKRNLQVEKMLVAVYEPILWRSLSAPNDVVRRQAACLLANAFPLRDPDATCKDSDLLMQRQFDALSSLLYDESPSVRMTAVEGIARIIGTFWELLPAGTIVSLVSTLITRLANDTSSASVRAAVLNGIGYILENHKGHALLKAELPRISGLVHDKNPAVRLALVKLLVRVSSIRNIHFYEIVPIEELHQRLVLDQNRPAIMTQLSSLLLRSYFPQGSSGSTQVARCLAFISQNKDAAIAYYSNVYKHAPVGCVCKLAVLLLRCLVTALHEQKDDPGMETEEPEYESESLMGLTMRYRVALLQTIGSLIKSVWKELNKKRHTASAELLAVEINSETLKILLYALRDDSTCRLPLCSMVEIFKQIHSEQVKLDTLRNSHIERFCCLHPQTPKREMLDAILCLRAWGESNQMVRLVTESLLTWDANVEGGVDPIVALGVIELTMANRMPDGCVFDSDHNLTANLVRTIEDISKTHYLAKDVPKPAPDSIISRIFKVHMRLMIHLAKGTGTKSHIHSIHAPEDEFVFILDAVRSRVMASSDCKAGKRTRDGADIEDSDFVAAQILLLHCVALAWEFLWTSKLQSEDINPDGDLYSTILQTIEDQISSTQSTAMKCAWLNLGLRFVNQSICRQSHLRAGAASVLAKILGSTAFFSNEVALVRKCAKLCLQVAQAQPNGPLIEGFLNCLLASMLEYLANSPEAEDFPIAAQNFQAWPSPIQIFAPFLFQRSLATNVLRILHNKVENQQQDYSPTLAMQWILRLVAVIHIKNLCRNESEKLLRYIIQNADQLGVNQRTSEALAAQIDK